MQSCEKVFKVKGTSKRHSQVHGAIVDTHHASTPQAHTSEAAVNSFFSIASSGILNSERCVCVCVCVCLCVCLCVCVCLCACGLSCLNMPASPWPLVASKPTT